MTSSRGGLGLKIKAVKYVKGKKVRKFVEHASLGGTQKKEKLVLLC